MTRDAERQTICREELRFFGNVAAAISHEINNKLAVINEKAGLLNDLAAMLARGREVAPERFDDQSRKIVDQVRLAKQSVGALNRFAHSADNEVTTIDVADVLEFVVALYARKAAAAEVELSVAETGAPTVTGDLFLLQALIGRGIDIALRKAGARKAVTVGAETARDGFHIRFAGLDGLTEPVGFPGSELGVAALLEHSGASYRSEQNGTELLLVITDSALTHGRTP